MDKKKSMEMLKQREAEGVSENDGPTIEYQAIDIYRELIDEKKGVQPVDENQALKREKMKLFLK